jgi:hypothetical protein
MADAADTKKETPSKSSPPYVPFKTFLSALDTLQHGMPNQIDRSVFPSLSGVTQSQLLSAFRFFGLITADNKPSAELSKLVEDENNRQPHIKKLLEKGYPSVFALGLANASPNSVDAELRKFGLSGDTHEKAKSFFLKAARFGGVQLSPYLLKVTRTSAPRKRRAASGVASAPGSSHLASRTNEGASRQFTLPGGTVVTFGTSADAFHMDAGDRKIVFDFLEQLEKYPAGQSEQEEEEEGADEDQ